MFARIEIGMFEYGYIVYGCAAKTLLNKLDITSSPEIMLWGNEDPSHSNPSRDGGDAFVN